MPKKKPVSEMTEAQLKSRLVTVATKIPGLRLFRNSVGVFKNPKGKFYRHGLPKGSSDFIGIYYGRFVALELKTSGKKPDKQQIKWLAMIKMFGGIVGVVTPESVEDLPRYLREYEQAPGQSFPHKVKIPSKWVDGSLTRKRF